MGPVSVFSRRGETLRPSGDVGQGEMAGRGHSKRGSRTRVPRVCGEFGWPDGGSVADGRRQAGSGIARSRARARVNWVSQGQRWGRCRVSPNPPKVWRYSSGMGDEGQREAMVRARFRVNGAGVCLQPPRGDLATVWGRWARRDGGERTQQEGLADQGAASLRGVRLAGWRVSCRRAPSGWEWNRSQPCQGASELGFPRPALGQMQGKAAR